MGFDVGSAAGTVHLDVWTWPLVLDLAMAYGWQPRGTEAPPPVYARVPTADAEAIAEAVELAARVAAEAWSPRSEVPPLEIDPPPRDHGRYRWILCEACADEDWGGTYMTIQRQKIGAEDGAALATALRSALAAWPEACESLARARGLEEARIHPSEDSPRLPTRMQSSVSEFDWLRRRLAALADILEAGPATIA